MNAIEQANGPSWIERVKNLRDERLTELLQDCADYLERHEDTVDRSDGTVGPNAAMSLRARILAELAS